MSKSDVLGGIRYFRDKYPATFWISDNLLNIIEESITKEELEIAVKNERVRQTEQHLREQRQREEAEQKRSSAQEDNRILLDPAEDLLTRFSNSGDKGCFILIVFVICTIIFFGMLQMWIINGK